MEWLWVRKRKDDEHKVTSAKLAEVTSYVTIVIV